MLINNTLDEDEVWFTAQVSFTLNNEHQIVVLSVDSINKVLESFVKGRLNYRNVVLDDYRQGKIYYTGAYRKLEVIFKEYIGKILI